MTTKSTNLFYFFGFLISTLLILIIYLSNTSSLTEEQIQKKNLFVKLLGLPDLAISTEVGYIRHRSISNFFSSFKDDGTLRENTLSSFTYTQNRSINVK